MHTRESIAALLNRNNEAVERAIVRLYSFQTRQEQNVEHTINRNDVGFSACHGKKGAYYAKWVLSGKHLTGRHLVKAREMALKYTRQLMEFANGTQEER